WNDFRAYLDKYQLDTYQIFRQSTFTFVEKRNAEITATNNRRVRGSETDAQRLIPLELKTFWTKLVCTHGWNRKRSGKDFRKFHFDRGTGCKANIKVAVAWDNAKGIFMVRVTDYDVRHNHAVSKAAYQNHVSNRQVQDPTLLAFVDELQAAGANPKLMMQYLRKKTGTLDMLKFDMFILRIFTCYYGRKECSLRYVHNLVSRILEKRN
ncbi:ABC transporter, partial [Phytophthora megakarya]